MANFSVLGLHDGIFHADDVAAAAIWEMYFGPTRFVRTRDAGTLAGIDFIADVGMKAEVLRGEDGEVLGGTFDHHQKEAKAYPNGVKYSALGYVLDFLTGEGLIAPGQRDYLLEHGFYSVQALDNGQKLDGLQDSPLSFVQFLNCTWEDGAYSAKQDEQFRKAVEMAKEAISAMLEQFESKRRAESIVEKAISKAVGGIIVLEQYAPWDEPVVRHNGGEPKIVAVVFQSKPGDWKAQVVPKEMGSFESWILLDEEACKSQPGFVFCHKGRFIAGFQSKESALAALS